MILDFLLRYSLRSGDPDALRMAEETLDAMARGGIYDQVGGGFHRYSTDARWLVPHFEKMLYDNALLVRAYVRGFQATGRQDFRKVVEETLHYITREMTHPGGAFFSSLDADSEGVEGKFYIWSSGEIDSILGEEEGRAFRAAYDITEEENWEHSSIPNLPGSRQAALSRSGLDAEAFESLIGRARDLLYGARARRIWPGRDEKVITSWNAMMLHAFAEAGGV